MAKKVIVTFHDSRGYDSHLIIKEIGRFDVKAYFIPNGLEKYLAFTINKHLVFIDSFQVYSMCSVRSCMTIDVHSFWLLILKALCTRIQKNLHSLFSLWSKFRNGSSGVLTKEFFRDRSSNPSFEPKFSAT